MGQAQKRVAAKDQWCCGVEKHSRTLTYRRMGESHGATIISKHEAGVASGQHRLTRMEIMAAKKEDDYSLVTLQRVSRILDHWSDTIADLRDQVNTAIELIEEENQASTTQ